MLPDILVEAHSYSGGLRYTLFPKDTSRPAWVPPADSVGWRDDFSIESDDAIIEFHQRLHVGETVSWIAVYRKSIDAQFGDRSNHAGVGVWLRGKRIADARSLLLALDQYTPVLAKNPDPQLLNDAMAAFVSDKFLGSYLLPADALPRDWAGAPAADATLVDTQYKIVRAPNFAVAVDRAADQITWLSLGWAMEGTPSRTIILATARNSPPPERELKELDPPGGLLAEIVQRVPTAFDEEKRRVREADAELASQKASWDQQRKLELQGIETARRQMHMLDGQPATNEGLAARLNVLSQQMVDVRETLRGIANRSAFRADPPPVQPRPYQPREIQNPRREIGQISRQPVRPESSAEYREGTPPYTLYVVGFISIAAVIFAAYWFLLRPDNRIAETAAPENSVQTGINEIAKNAADANGSNYESQSNQTER